MTGSEAPRLSVSLTDAARRALYFQDYGRAPAIEGVSLRPMRKFRAENGWFAEYLRLRDGRVEGLAVPEGEMEVRQLSVSLAAPNRVNAFHIHPKIPQNELWTVLAGQLLVWLVDCREGSPSAGCRQRVLLSSEEPYQLYIPAGVAHGYRAGPEGAVLVYAMDQQFDATDPNEGRLPWDFFGAELWEEDRG